MPDNGDDRLSSDDLLRKAKEELERPLEEVSSVDDLSAGSDQEYGPQPFPLEQDEAPPSLSDSSQEEPLAAETGEFDFRDTDSTSVAPLDTAEGESGDGLNGDPEPMISFPTGPHPPASDEPNGRGGVGALLNRVPRWWIIVGVVTFGGFVYNFFTEAKRDDSGVIVEAGEVAADDIRVGDCLMEPENVSPEEDFVFETLEAVPCSAPHDMEAYASFVHSAVSYPGDDALFEWGLERCDPAFETFTGVSFENEARFEVTVVTPDSEAWSSGERTIDCLVLNFDGTPLVGSQEDQGLLGFPGLRVSDCYDMLEAETYLAFEEVACDEAHDIEHYAANTLPHDEDMEFPGDAWLDDYAVSTCGRQFESYVGREWTLSVAPDYVWIYPTEETWSFSDRLVQCFLVDPAQGKLVRSYGS